MKLGIPIISLTKKNHFFQVAKMRNEETPVYFKYLESLLAKSGTGYFVGNSLTLADIAAFDAITGYLHNFLVFDAEKYPLLEKNRNLVLENENIKKYVDSRKPSER